MPFDPQFALNIMLPLAEAAYDLSKLPSGWTVADPIEPDDFGFIAVGSEAIVVSIRGTEVHPTEKDPDREWIEDFDGIAVQNQLGKGMVHQGFQGQYLELRAGILGSLRKLNLDLPVWITGHSLGAALAVLCQADLAPVYKTLAYTWAAPRVGWHDFANWFASLNVECNRIVNRWDVVPRVPSILNGYEHVGFQVEIDGGEPKIGEDFFKTAHNLELSYRPGMERLISGIKAA